MYKISNLDIRLLFSKTITNYFTHYITYVYFKSWWFYVWRCDLIIGQGFESLTTSLIFVLKKKLLKFNLLPNYI